MTLTNKVQLAFQQDACAGSHARSGRCDPSIINIFSERHYRSNPRRFDNHKLTGISEYVVVNG
jgi:hypothetical protein